MKNIKILIGAVLIGLAELSVTGQATVAGNCEINNTYNFSDLLIHLRHMSLPKFNPEIDSIKNTDKNGERIYTEYQLCAKLFNYANNYDWGINSQLIIKNKANLEIVLKNLPQFTKSIQIMDQDQNKETQQYFDIDDEKSIDVAAADDDDYPLDIQDGVFGNEYKKAGRKAKINLDTCSKEEESKYFFNANKLSDIYKNNKKLYEETLGKIITEELRQNDEQIQLIHKTGQMLWGNKLELPYLTNKIKELPCDLSLKLKLQDAIIRLEFQLPGLEAKDYWQLLPFVSKFKNVYSTRAVAMIGQMVRNGQLNVFIKALLKDKKYMPEARKYNIQSDDVFTHNNPQESYDSEDNEENDRSESEMRGYKPYTQFDQPATEYLRCATYCDSDVMKFMENAILDPNLQNLDMQLTKNQIDIAISEVIEKKTEDWKALLESLANKITASYKTQYSELSKIRHDEVFFKQFINNEATQTNQIVFNGTLKGILKLLENYRGEYDHMLNENAETTSIGYLIIKLIKENRPLLIECLDNLLQNTTYRKYINMDQMDQYETTVNLENLYHKE